LIFAGCIYLPPGGGRPPIETAPDNIYWEVPYTLGTIAYTNLGSGLTGADGDLVQPLLTVTSLEQLNALKLRGVPLEHGYQSGFFDNKILILITLSTSNTAYRAEFYTVVTDTQRLYPVARYNAEEEYGDDVVTYYIYSVELSRSLIERHDIGSIKIISNIEALNTFDGEISRAGVYWQVQYNLGAISYMGQAGIEGLKPDSRPIAVTSLEQLNSLRLINYPHEFDHDYTDGFFDGNVLILVTFTTSSSGFLAFLEFDTVAADTRDLYFFAQLVDVPIDGGWTTDIGYAIFSVEVPDSLLQSYGIGGIKMSSVRNGAWQSGFGGKIISLPQ